MGTTRFVGRYGNGFVRSLVIAYVYLMLQHRSWAQRQRNAAAEQIINTNDLRGELQSMEREHLRLKEEARLSLTPCKLCVYIVEKNQGKPWKNALRRVLHASA